MPEYNELAYAGGGCVVGGLVGGLTAYFIMKKKVGLGPKMNMSDAEKKALEDDFMKQCKAPNRFCVEAKEFAMKECGLTERQFACSAMMLHSNLDLGVNVG